MLAEERREQFKADVAEMKLKTGASRRDSLFQIAGGLLMLIGVVAVFLAYEASLHQKDQRNIGSEQILAIAFLTLAVVGAALFLVGSIARVLRVWLLRQLYEGQAHVEQLSAALRDR
jgi:hypothetical protein